MRYRITAPVKGANCTVAGVVFKDSIGETDDHNAVAYFRRHGYTVEDRNPQPEPEPEPPVDVAALRAELEEMRARAEKAEAERDERLTLEESSRLAKRVDELEAELSNIKREPEGEPDGKAASKPSPAKAAKAAAPRPA